MLVLDLRRCFQRTIISVKDDKKLACSLYMTLTGMETDIICHAGIPRAINSHCVKRSDEFSYGAKNLC